MWLLHEHRNLPLERIGKKSSSFRNIWKITNIRPCRESREFRWTTCWPRPWSVQPTTATAAGFRHTIWRTRQAYYLHGFLRNSNMVYHYRVPVMVSLIPAAIAVVGWTDHGLGQHIVFLKSRFSSHDQMLGIFQTFPNKELLLIDNLLWTRLLTSYQL